MTQTFHISRNFDLDTKEISQPILSVLVPYYHDDPSALLEALSSQIMTGLRAEILLYDDGTADHQVNAKLQAIAKNSQAAITLILATENKGRSEARNQLRKAARADWVLFLDADMLPKTDQFLAHYLEIIKQDQFDIIFGGFQMPSTATKDTDLHRAFSQKSDCLSAMERTEKGPQYVCSSNLCVRRRVLEIEPFDTEFSGWGWEDSEWAARTAKSYRLLHAENPAYHLGLESTETLLRRFRDSAHNYDRFTQKHPELAQKLNLFRLMRTLRKLPGQKLMRPILSMLVRNRIAIVPMGLRLLALKLWRASWYAERCSA